MEQSFKPASARVQIIDAIRGLAIFGILVINMGYFAWPKVRNWSIYPMAYQSTSDMVIDFLLRFLAKGKFYIIFSFLFGLGMAMQKDRSRDQRENFTTFFLTRLTILMLLGAIHGLVIWNGDILLTYAVMGFPLLLFQNAKPKFLLGTAGLLFLGQFFWFYGRPLYLTYQSELSEGIWQAARDWADGEAYALDKYTSTLAVYKNGSWWEIAVLRAQEYWQLVRALPSWGLDILISFLIGAWAWRKGLFTETGMHRALLKRIALWFGLIGVTTNLLSFTLLDLDLFGVLMNLGFSCWFLGKFFLGYAYLAIILILWDAGRLTGFAAVLAPVGRMALSNYLMHSVVFTLLFNSYGLGRMGDFGETLVFALGLTLFIIQIPLSHIWLHHFHFGPCEWLWRTLTYGKLQRFWRNPA